MHWPWLVLSGPRSHSSLFDCWTKPSPQLALVQLLVHSSSLSSLPSSHSSCALTTPSPQEASLHSLVHSSLLLSLPSSQPSPGPFRPSPQMFCLHFEVHEEPSSLLSAPRSHSSSPGSWSPSPQTFSRHSALQNFPGPLSLPLSHSSPRSSSTSPSPHGVPPPVPPVVGSSVVLEPDPCDSPPVPDMLSSPPDCDAPDSLSLSVPESLSVADSEAEPELLSLAVAEALEVEPPPLQATRAVALLKRKRVGDARVTRNLFRDIKNLHAPHIHRGSLSGENIASPRAAHALSAPPPSRPSARRSQVERSGRWPRGEATSAAPGGELVGMKEAQVIGQADPREGPYVER